MDFIAIDVETANSDLASICQIGLAIFQHGRLIDSWSSLVDPCDYFEYYNVGVHGITPDSVIGAPRWIDVVPKTRPLIEGAVLVCHTPFDKIATSRACERVGLNPFNCQWLDTARVVRRTWPEQFASKGYGLKKVAKALGIQFKHHDALEDARAAGEILCLAAAHSGLSINDMLVRTNRPISPQQSEARTGSSDGPLLGEVVVFTGALNIPRREAADLAARAGCAVATSVNNKTTLLIVGDQDVSKLGGKEKSAKHLKAEEMIAKGSQIRILSESDFRCVVATEA